ncbi:MAG: ribonuclease HII [Alphaproteobacteria bacterium]|nr:ribonuclease HII [Alphaproteobacteria bacterium]
MTKPDLSIERTHTGIICGVDEAGRGPWAGPVVAAAAIIDASNIPAGINDSKKLTAAKRDALFDHILACAKTGVGIASVEEIDTLNILGATKLAMCRAVENLGVAPDVALVDGNRVPEKMRCRVQTVVGGDALSLSIAAASIIAKVTRDRMMEELAREYPGYGWEKNAGYGTALHQAGLAKYGVTPHHRRSFAPIRVLLEQELCHSDQVQRVEESYKIPRLCSG